MIAPSFHADVWTRVEQIAVDKSKWIANAETWAAGIPVPTYAIDDETAIKVTGNSVEVISEGHWKLFAR